MKKYFFLAMALCAGLGMTSCGDDGDGNGSGKEESVMKNVTLKTAPYADDAIKLEIPSGVVDTKPLIIKDKEVLPSEIELTPGGDFIFSGKLVVPALSKAGSDDDFFLRGVFTKNIDGSYTINGIGTFSYGKSGNTYNLKFKPQGSTEEYMLTGQKVEPAPSSTITSYLARTWTIERTELQGTINGVNVMSTFKGPGCSLKEVVAYANEKGAKVESVEDERAVIDGIIFTPSLTFMIVYKGETYDVGFWKWSNSSNGTLTYGWNAADMGVELLKTKNGAEASASVTFEGNFCKLSLKAKVDNYDISVVFYLKPATV